MIFSRVLMAYPVVAPPDVPVDRIAILRKAFDATMTDPAFVEDAAKMGLEIDPVTGAELAQLVSKVYSSPGDVLERARRAASGG